MAGCFTNMGEIRLRPFKYAAAALLFLSLALWLSCAGEEPVTRETFVMGTRARIIIYGMGRAEAMEAAGRGLGEMHRLESIMSTWNPGSELSGINMTAGGAPRKTSPELTSLLHTAGQFSELTKGVFDVTAGPLVSLWGFQGKTRKNLPSAEEIYQAMELVDYKKIALDTAASTVSIPKGARIDLAGIAKGYAVDRCASILRKAGARSALIDLGGNMYAIGSPPGKNGWTVGIRDPKQTREVVGYLIISGQAVATSGNYENFAEMEGEVFGHLIDPRTGRPADAGVLSVTVISPTALSADVLSTALFIMGSEKGNALLRKLSGPKVSDSFPYIGRTFKSDGSGPSTGYAEALFITDHDGRPSFIKSAPMKGKLFLEQ